MARRNLIINGALVVGIVILAVVAYEWLHTPSKAAATRQTTTVTRGEVASTVSASGNVTSAVNVGVSFSGCTGIVTSIAVKPGDVVTSGQTLATVDPSAAQTALAAAQTQLAAAQASLNASVVTAKTNLSNAQTTENLDSAQAYENMQVDSQGLYTTAAAAQSGYNAWLNGATASGALLKDFQSWRSTQAKDSEQVSSAQTSLSQAQSSTSQGQLTVNTDQTAVTTAQTNIGLCTLTAPLAGTIVTVNGTVGATPGSGAVAAGSSSSSSSSSTGSSTSSSNSSSANSSNASTSSSASSGVSSSSGFITISDMTKLEIPASVTESDIGSVKVGESASVVFAALTTPTNPSGATVAGTVSEVDLASTVSSGVVSYGVVISLTSPPADLRLGQSGNVTITTASKQNVLRLASSAITTLGRIKTVTVSQGSGTQVVTVTTGVTGNGETEIVSGLTEGQTVLLPSATTTSTLNLLGGTSGSLLGGGR